MAAMSRSAITDQELNDVALMQRVALEDQDALLALYTRYGSHVHGLALRILRDSALAEEATQDTFLKVWRKSVNWDPSKGQLSSWLLTVARYTAIDLWRRERRQSPASIDLAEFALEAHDQPFEAHDARWYDGQILRQLMTRLSPDQALVIELAFFYGMTHSQMAEHLGWPLGTVKTRTRSGLTKLRDLWEAAAHRVV